MMDPCAYKGSWSLVCDVEVIGSTGSYGIETMLKSLKEIQKRLPGLFPMPPKEVNSQIKMNTLQVFVADDSVEGIKKSAEAIRHHVDFPFIMYYFKKKDFNPKENTPHYMHTVGGELYKYGKPENSAGCVWNKISENKELNTEINDLLPSQVTDRVYIHFPVNEGDFKKNFNEKGGKWILHSLDWKTLDSYWKNLIRLYDTGVLVGLKSRTASLSATENGPVFETKAIMCYTADANCKSSVKRAAESIFICTGYSEIMYYKTNQSSLDGHYKHERFLKKTSRYMFTCKREIYELDRQNRWKKLIFDNEKHEYE